TLPSISDVFVSYWRRWIIVLPRRLTHPRDQLKTRATNREHRERCRCVCVNCVEGGEKVVPPRFQLHPQFVSRHTPTGGPERGRYNTRQGLTSACHTHGY